MFSGKTRYHDEHQTQLIGSHAANCVNPDLESPGAVDTLWTHFALRTTTDLVTGGGTQNSIPRLQYMA
jgi:hypothetical protein